MRIAVSLWEGLFLFFFFFTLMIDVDVAQKEDKERRPKVGSLFHVVNVLV